MKNLVDLIGNTVGRRSLGGLTYLVSGEVSRFFGQDRIPIKVNTKPAAPQMTAKLSTGKSSGTNMDIAYKKLAAYSEVNGNHEITFYGNHESRVNFARHEVVHAYHSHYNSSLKELEDKLDNSRKEILEIAGADEETALSETEKIAIANYSNTLAARTIALEILADAYAGRKRKRGPSLIYEIPADIAEKFSTLFKRSPTSTNTKDLNIPRANVGEYIGIKMIEAYRLSGYGAESLLANIDGEPSVEIRKKTDESTSQAMLEIKLDYPEHERRVKDNNVRRAFTQDCTQLAHLVVNAYSKHLDFVQQKLVQ